MIDVQYLIENKIKNLSQSEKTNEKLRAIFYIMKEQSFVDEGE
jgi:hypothetical protein